MRIVFIGSVQVGYSALTTLYNSNYEVSLIVTLSKSRAASTSGYVDFEPLAAKNRTDIHFTEDVNSEASVNAVRDANPDLIVVCGWQRLVSSDLLALPKKGTIGFHSSLLPRYRGRAPVNWAIIMGEKETGVTMFYLDEEADAGDIIAQERFPIDILDSCETVYKKSEKAISRLLEKYLLAIETDSVKKIHNPSRSHPCYPKRTPKDGIIDFNRPAIDVYNWIRALTKPYPGAFYIEDGKKITVWTAMIGRKDAPDSIVKETADIPITITKWESCDV